MEDRRNSPCQSSQESDPATPIASTSSSSSPPSSSTPTSSLPLPNGRNNRSSSSSSNLRNNCGITKECEESSTSGAGSSPQKSKTTSSVSLQPSVSSSSSSSAWVAGPSASGSGPGAPAERPSSTNYSYYNEDSPSKSSFSLTKNMEANKIDGEAGAGSVTVSVASTSGASGTGATPNVKSKDNSESQGKAKCDEFHDQEDLPHNRIRRGNVCEAWQSTKSCLKERISYLFNNDTLSDVSFLVGRGRVRIPGHKFVLAIGSPVFDAMFNGLLQESNRTVELPDVEPEAFLALLKFLYSDEVSVSAESVLTVLYTAKKYAVPTLEEHCVAFLKDNLTAENAFLLLSQARLFDEPQLAALCLDCIDKNTGAAISADGFLEVDLATLSAVLERDTLRIREYNLFHAVLRWAAAECARRGMEVTPENQRYSLGRTLNLIRFPLMPVEEFAIGVAQLGLLSETELVRLFLNFNISSTNVEHRPKMEFIDRPRCYMTGKQLSVYRFQQVETRWGYNGLSDQIRFTTDRRIYVVGFGLYGGLYGTKEYRVDIQISNTLTNLVLGHTSDSFISDGSKSTFKIMFKEPIEILPDLLYTASATLRGPDSHYGAKGQRKVGVECPDGTTVNFSFSYSSDNNNGTSVEDGQIPELIFHT